MLCIFLSTPACTTSCCTSLQTTSFHCIVKAHASIPGLLLQFLVSYFKIVSGKACVATVNRIDPYVFKYLLSKSCSYKHLSMREADSALYLAKYAYVPLLVCHDSGTCPQALRLL